MNETILAFLASGAGGVAVKAFEWAITRKSDKFDEEHILRQELRDEIDGLRDELAQLKRESNEWQQKYWDQIRINNSLESKINRLTNDIEELKQELSEYTSGEKKKR